MEVLVAFAERKSKFNFYFTRTKSKSNEDQKAAASAKPFPYSTADWQFHVQTGGNLLGASNVAAAAKK